MALKLQKRRGVKFGLYNPTTLGFTVAMRNFRSRGLLPLTVVLPLPCILNLSRARALRSSTQSKQQPPSLLNGPFCSDFGSRQLLPKFASPHSRMYSLLPLQYVSIVFENTVVQFWDCFALSMDDNNTLA